MKSFTANGWTCHSFCDVRVRWNAPSLSESEAPPCGQRKKSIGRAPRRTRPALACRWACRARPRRHASIRSRSGREGNGEGSTPVGDAEVTAKAGRTSPRRCANPGSHRGHAAARPQGTPWRLGIACSRQSANDQSTLRQRATPRAASSLEFRHPHRADVTKGGHACRAKTCGL